MLAYLDDQCFDLAPIPKPEGHEHLRFNPKQMQMEFYVGSHRVFLGPIYYSNAKFVSIDPKTGKIEVNGVGTVTIRAVYGSNHVEMEQEFV